MATYQPDRHGWREFANGPELRSLVAQIAERAKAHAESISPRSDREDGEPHYQDSFTVETYTDARFRSGPRVAARLINTSGHAAEVEWGKRQNGGNGKRVLGRTFDYLGGQGG
jgi:hypothetical protein